MLRKHDEQLQLISQQIEELLKMSNEKKNNVSLIKPKMCTVETMTSLEWPNEQRKVISHKRNVAQKSTPSPRRETENRRMVTINESTSSFVANEKATTVHSPSRGYFSPERETARCARGDERDDSSSDDFYDNMLANIDGILRSSSISESECDLTRSSCSPTPPRKSSQRRVRLDIDQQQTQNHNHKQHHQQQHYSAETIYINRLASKYLVTGRERNSSKYMVSERKEYVSNSLATKNYLEKYGLQGSSRGDRLHAHDRILDLDRLKRQPKYK